MEELLICPNAENCLLYKNWSKNSKDCRLGVIMPHAPREKGYDCLVLIATQDPSSEGGVLVDKHLEERLPKNNKTFNYECLYIKQLNLSIEILNFLKRSK